MRSESYKNLRDCENTLFAIYELSKSLSQISLLILQMISSLGWLCFAR